MTEPRFLGADAADKLAGLVFELAAQLHEERAARLALQQALLDAGVLPPEAVERAARGAAGRETARAALARAQARLLAILTEADDAQGPLRAEAAQTPNAE